MGGFSIPASRPISSADAAKEDDMAEATVPTPTLEISPEKVGFIIQMAREFEAKDVVTEPDPGSNPTDDGMIGVLEDHGDDATQQELRAFINGLTEDEQIELVALTWLGRGDGDVSEWGNLRKEAARLHNARTAQYLIGKPLLAEHLDEGLAQLGYTLEEFTEGTGESPGIVPPTEE
jgi:hypothetical protein